MLITTKLNSNENTITIELETDTNLMEISLNLADVEKNVKAMTGITDNLVVQKTVELFSSLFGIKLSFKKKDK